VVPVLANNPLNATIDDEHGAGAAGSHPAVKRATFKGYSPAGSLADGILFGMHRTHAMLRHSSVVMNYFLHQMAHVITMGKALRGADISGNKHLPVAHDDATAASTVTGSSFSSRMGQIEKIFIPGGTLVF
jgi:hypothetical protein